MFLVVSLELAGRAFGRLAPNRFDGTAVTTALLKVAGFIRTEERNRV